MAEIVIQAEKISKRYRLGTLGSRSLRRDMQSWWESYIWARPNSSHVAEKLLKVDGPRQIWALKEVDLEIREGEALGIIGHNGAGKSTLLKILSRIVKPTEGIIRGKGKVSSLLEVGTGFHPELTGKENIMISGHVLGMSKKEIIKKFDAIVDFSGVENFLDTPIKRYSSGMYVRLAFAVAAHLEPEILIVDEVLAVGDAEFQKKCLAKMNEASTKSGRTIIFVSHNMQAIGNICSKAVWLDKGSVREQGPAKMVINTYLSTLQSKNWVKEYPLLDQAPGNDVIRIKRVELNPILPDDNAVIDIRTPLTINFTFYNNADNILLAAGIHLFTISGECIFDVSHPPVILRKGTVNGVCSIPGNFLNDGAYYISIIFVENTSKEIFYFENCLSFEVEDFRENMNWYGKWMGYVRPDFPVTLSQSLMDLM